MPNMTRFTVRVPAMRHDGMTVVPDNQSVYVGPMPSGPDGAPVTLQNAIVTGGVRQGEKMLSCTYITSMHPIPGFGDIDYT